MQRGIMQIYEMALRLLHEETPLPCARQSVAQDEVPPLATWAAAPVLQSLTPKPKGGSCEQPPQSG